MPRLAALAADGAGGGAQSRPSYAVAAEGRPRLRAAVGGLRRVLALDFQVGFPAGAVVLFIHWRWQPTGAGDLFFMDRRWPSDAEAAAGRPRPRAATLGHAAVRAQELLRVNHFRYPRARAREAPGADSRSRFHCDAEAAAGRPRPRAATLGHAAVRAQELLRVNHFRYPRARARGARRRFQIAVSFFSFSGATPAMPRLAALAADGAGGGAQSRPSYAVAAEGRPRLRAAVGVSASTISVTLRARARGARRRFQIAVSFFRFSSADRAGAAAVGGAGRRWCRWRSSIAAELRGGCRRPPAPPRRRRGSASTISVTLRARARGARRRFQIAVSFFSFSGATPAMPRLAALAADGAGGGAQSRPSYAVAAEGRPRLRAAVGGLRRVLALDFQVGFPAGAVVLFIHWRWQPTGAGDLFFMDRRWPSAAEAAAGRPRLRAATLGHAAVRAQELLRVNHFRQPRARARGADSRSRFHFLVSAARTVGGAGRRWCRRRSSIAAEQRGGCRRPPAPPLRRRRRFQIAVSFFSFSSADRWRRWPPLVPAAELNRGRATRWLPKAARASAPP